MLIITKNYTFSVILDGKMVEIVTKIRLWLLSDDASTAIEYALIVGAIALAVVTAVNSSGVSIASIFTTVNTYIAAELANF